MLCADLSCRPLLVYGVMELLALLCHVALLATGFRLRQLDGITYYTLRVGPQKLVPAIRCVHVCTFVSLCTVHREALTGCGCLGERALRVVVGCADAVELRCRCGQQGQLAEAVTGPSQLHCAAAA